jgi:class 3 adenylate cyclase
MSVAANPLTQATRPIIHQDWDFYTQAVARLLLGWAEPEAAQAFAQLVGECTSPEFASRALAATASFDVSDLLGNVQAPTLVLHRPEQRISNMDNARALAAGIPEARLSLLGGEQIAPYLGETRAIVEEVDAFLTGREAIVFEPSREDDSSIEAAAPSGSISTIVFTDVVASTEMVERLGDEQARASLRSLERAVSAAASVRAGRVVKHLGDGSLLEFASASEALDFARELQTAREDDGLHVAIGLAAGEPIREEGDLHGAVVVLASRITEAAGSGEVLASDAVRQLVIGKSFEFDDAGEHTLKGFDEPVRVWRLRL